ncbi:hypothetical protein B0H13DRAFT_2682393 [Mycena leptocephala]|nr:hypothetical protein B0H13DRAFT_2682393 [Mycena leptocephala]
MERGLPYDAQRALMPAISGSAFRRTLREQHLAQKSKAGTQSDSHVGTMVQKLIFFGDSSVQYNPLVASTSLRRINGHLPAHG